MASLTSRLKQVFGWKGEKRPGDKPVSLRDQATMWDNVQSAADQYHNEMSFRYQKRVDRYDVYEAMDQMGDVSSVLDAYGEDATQEDQQHKKTVWVEARNKKVKTVLTSLLHDTLHVEDWIEGCCRDTGKNGDDFAQVIADKDGIRSLFWRDPRDIERIENKEGILIGFEEMKRLGQYKQRVTAELQQGRDGSSVQPTYDPWDIVHFRIYKRKRMPREKLPNIYGTSLLMGSERIAKQVKILDDLLMIMRLTRSLDHKIYYIDTGRSAVEEEAHILRRWKRALKRKTYVDPTTGRFDSRFDPFAWTEDEFWPAPRDKQSRVEVTPGITNVADIVDIDHFRDKFFGSLRAPKAYFGYEGDVNARATLSSQSVKWARAVRSLQRAVIQGLTRLCQIHLAYLGLDTDATKFQVMMTTPSIVELLDKLEAWQNVVDVAERMSTLGETLQLDRRDWTIYILENVMWLSKEEVEKFVPKEDEMPPPEEQPGEQPAQGGEPPQPFATPFSQPEAPPAQAMEPGAGAPESSNGVGSKQHIWETYKLIQKIREHREQNVLTIN